MQDLRLVLIALAFIASPAWAVTPGPDTIIVDEHTYYRNGYDPKKIKPRDHEYKFRYAHINNLEALINLELQIYFNVTNIYKNHQEANELPKNNFTQSVEEYLEDFRTTSLALLERRRCDGSAASVAAILTTNIITPFLTTRRFRNYIRPWMTVAKRSRDRTSFHDSVIRYVRSVHKLKDGPFAIEFQMSMMSILLTQFYHDLRASDIAKGYMRGKELGVTLMACHCLEIGVHGIAMALFPLGIEWLDVSIDKINAGDDTADLSFAWSWLERATKMHDRQWKPMDSLSFDAIYFSKPLANFTRGEERKWRKQITCEDQDKMEQLLDPQAQMPLHLHLSVCKGDVEQSDQEKSKLFCWYERKIHPAWTIGPLKAEFISRFPRGEVVQFYDLVHDNYMKAIRTDPENVNFYHSFLDEFRMPIPKNYLAAVAQVMNESLLSRFHTLIEAVTGLQCRNSIRGTQVVSYVPGGHSFIHEDWKSFDVGGKAAYHVVATFMLYIDEPEEGGETSYSRSLVKTNPLKGSAVFSFNFLRSGRKDHFAPHGACPLVFGSKWVVTQDIMYEDQVQSTCGLQENLRQEILVNGKSKYSASSKKQLILRGDK